MPCRNWRNGRRVATGMAGGRLFVCTIASAEPFASCSSIRPTGLSTKPTGCCTRPAVAPSAACWHKRSHSRQRRSVFRFPIAGRQRHLPFARRSRRHGAISLPRHNRNDSIRRHQPRLCLGRLCARHRSGSATRIHRRRPNPGQKPVFQNPVSQTRQTSPYAVFSVVYAAKCE